VNILPSDLADRLQSSSDFGFVNVKRSGDCTGYSYTIEWIANGGAKPSISITNAGSITPAGTVVTNSLVQPGGVIFKPISGDMTRTYQTNPQVSLVLNGILLSITNILFTKGGSFRWRLSIAMCRRKYMRLSMAIKSNTNSFIDGTIWHDFNHHWQWL
jgi:hypothetical protein